MMEPLHWKGKVVMGNSSFCVAMGMMALHVKGVNGQVLIKKRRYWPKVVRGDLIDNHMVGKCLGETKTYVQDIAILRVCIFLFVVTVTWIG